MTSVRYGTRLFKKQGTKDPDTVPVNILKRIRHPYIALHQGTDAAPTAFSASTDNYDAILYEPSSYPFCNLASHRPDSTARFCSSPRCLASLAQPMAATPLRDKPSK
jgi:hypothetical protein